MRITQRAVVLTSMQGLHSNLESVGRLQQQLTSGKTISKPSDSPTGTNRAMQNRNDTRAAEQHARNISDGKGWLAQADTALQSMISMTQRVQALTVQARNGGTMSPEALQALSIEVATLREGLLGVANQQISGRPVFGGITSGNTAYDATGTWVGNDTATVTRRVADTETVRIDITGPEAFGPPGADLFALVDQIAANIAANPGALAANQDDLDAALDRMLTAVADVGARQARIERAEQATSDRLLTLQSTLSEIESIDLPKTIMELEMQRVGYQAALSATAKVIQPTLMDFLR